MGKEKLGLVLSGGGACGAYEAGVIKAMAKIGLEPQVISGASIGALNGAVIASIARMPEAANKLEILWRGLTPEKVLKLKRNRVHKRDISLASLQLLFNKVKGSSLVDAVKTIHSEVWDKLSEKDKRYFAILDDSPIETIIGSAININNLYKGRELYVSVFPGSEGGLKGALEDLIHWILSDRKSEFHRVQDLPPDQIMKILKASASIPLFFPGQEINGKIYRDGGLGGRLTSQGNTPVEPLIKAGCSHAVVVILEKGTPPVRKPSGTKMVELRPSKTILTQGDIKAIFDFSPGHIEELMELGEKDTLENQELYELQLDFEKRKNILVRLGKTISRKISRKSH